MFGYVTICRERLSGEGFQIFRSYYCGLCREIGKSCSQAARLGLSYDITFLAVVLSSLGNDGETRLHRCMAKAGKKHLCAEHDRAVEYAADMGVILSYLKLSDDWNDDRSLKALAGMQLFRGAVRKAKKRYPKVYDEIKGLLDALSALEEKNCAVTDECADCFAKILEILFTPDFVTGTNERRALAWLGYNIGRWIYIIDAFSDIEKDIKKNSYNPFVCANAGMTADEIKSKIRRQAEESLTFTLENAASAYNLLDPVRNKEVIENILYIALKGRQRNILGVNNESL